MAAELSYGWWISANQYDVGPSGRGTASDYQKVNATNVYNTLAGLGFTVEAIAAVLGNMQYESCIDPACVYPKSSFPNQGATLADLDNSNAINITNSAYGLVQWLGTTTTPPAGNQLVSYAIRHNSQWYEGQIQMDRLTWEYQEGVKFHPQRVDGTYWTFDSFASSTADPQTLAKVWMVCYEGTYSVLDTRKDNAQYWYDYFGGSPDPGPGPGPGPDPEPPDPPPDPQPPDPPGPEPPDPFPDWINGYMFANYAVGYDQQYIPYDQCDCWQFVNMVWRRIPYVETNDLNLTSGTNSLWRSTRTFQTTSPFNQNPTPELWYKDTIDSCNNRFGTLPTGCLLFHKISEAGPPPIPPQYAGDGIGNFAHVGIYIGYGQVMQSGGRDAASVPGGGVHRSEFDPDAWNYVAFPCYVKCTDTELPELPKWMYNYLGMKKQEVLKHVKRVI